MTEENKKKLVNLKEQVQYWKQEYQEDKCSFEYYQAKTQPLINEMRKIYDNPRSYSE